MIKLATRKSKLALKQTDMVIDLIEKNTGEKCEKVLIVTKGDKILNKTLDKIGGKAIFIKELELSMEKGEAHGGVHSMKDVPYELPRDFSIVSTPFREDQRDAFISKTGCDFFSLPKGAKIGTGSIRRAMQLKLLRNDLEYIPIRGNVDTRLRKLKEEDFDGIILAAAGLKRLDLEDKVTHYFTIEQMVPAVAQGTIGIESYNKNPYLDVFKAINDEDVYLTIAAERTFLRELKGGCQVAVGANGYIEGNDFYMLGIFDVGGKLVKKDIWGPKENAIEIGRLLAEKIIKA